MQIIVKSKKDLVYSRCEHCLRRQAIWIIIFSILFVLIILGMISGKIISSKKKGNRRGTVISTATTANTTTTSAKITGIFLRNKMWKKKDYLSF